MFLRDPKAAEPNKAIGKIARIFRSLSMTNFNYLQQEESKHIRKNSSPMSENLLLTAAFLNLSCAVKVCIHASRTFFL
jgi:hypothetical protein